MKWNKNKWMIHGLSRVCSGNWRNYFCCGRRRLFIWIWIGLLAKVASNHAALKVQGNWIRQKRKKILENFFCGQNNIGREPTCALMPAIFDYFLILPALN